jgi:hypothetical protein|tara:strand:- start:15613 stop:15756 length:144 start_codon:yes stop_codon:yes gene_type:complete
VKQLIFFVLGASLFHFALFAVDWRLAVGVFGALVAIFAVFAESVDSV